MSFFNSCQKTKELPSGVPTIEIEKTLQHKIIARQGLPHKSFTTADKVGHFRRSWNIRTVSEEVEHELY